VTASSVRDTVLAEVRARLADPEKGQPAVQLNLRIHAEEHEGLRKMVDMGLYRSTTQAARALLVAAIAEAKACLEETDVERVR
jgi:hypothetical protein